MIEILPFALQGVVMGVDEFYCHQRRSLRRWERIGHPLDTCTFLIALGALFVSDRVWVFTVLAVFSCLFITKDEWEHRELSAAFENWLHAVLFVLHPVVLGWAGYLRFSGSAAFLPAVGTAFALASGFLVYQIVYWNWWRA